MVAILCTSVAAVPVRFTVPVTCSTEAAESIDLSPGRYIPEEVWQEAEDSLKALQDDRTRLAAENAVLKDYDEPTNWYILGAVFIAGTVAGAYLID